MLSAVSVAVALLLDRLFSEPRFLHPLVGFGSLANAVERKWYADSKVRGLLAMSGLVSAVTLWVAYIAWWLDSWFFDAICLYLALGWQSLLAHVQRIQVALIKPDIELARNEVRFLVSRETVGLDEDAIAKAGVESLLENGNDAIFAAIFWFVLAGVPGVIAYRLVNTLDAMWGYRNTRYRNFGWAAARLDDVLNFIPARLTAFSYALAGRFRRAIHCWKVQGPLWESPNAGPVMAAGAGSLGLVLGGPEIYHGQLRSRIVLGEGRRPDTNGIDEAIALVQRALLIWVVAIIIGGWLIETAW